MGISRSDRSHRSRSREAPIHTVALDTVPQSVRRARRFAAEQMADADADVGEVVVLLVSELVTNAVVHAGPHAPAATVGLALDVSPDRIRVEVEDASSNLPVIGDGALEKPTGRGLLLVQGLATRWGCDRADVGKTVWFEVAAAAATRSRGGDADE